MKVKCCLINHILISVLVFGWLITMESCDSKDHNHEVEYIPFQESKDGNWGMIGADGQVLFSEEFKNQPTVGINGRFMVKNSDGLWEIYTTEEKPQKIGGEYLQAGMFYEDVAPVVERGKPIQFINKDGKVKVTLDKIGGKTVSECRNFIHGLAAVKINDAWGAVDTSGKLVIEPNYSFFDISANGYILAVDKKYRDKSFADRIFVVLDPSGKEVSAVKGNKIDNLETIWTTYNNKDFVIDDAIVVKTKKDKETRVGLMNFDGEWMWKPNSKTKTLLAIRKDKVIFYDGENLGLANKEGEELIRAKFHELWFVDLDILSGKKSDSDNFSLYSLEGEKIGNEEYEGISVFWDGRHSLAKVAEHDWVLIDKQGKESKLKTDIYNIAYQFGDFTFESDLVDLEDIISALNIKKSGFLGLNMNLKGYQAINYINEIEGLGKPLSADARKYANDNSIWCKIKIRKVMVELETSIRGLVIRSQSRNGWWTTTNYNWSYQKAVPSFNISFDFERNPQLKGKMHELYERIKNAVKGVGKEVKCGKNAIVVEVDDNAYYYAYWAGGRVALYFGTYDIDSIDVDSFDNANENEKGIALQPGRIIDRVPTVDMDSIAVVADTTALE